MTTEDVQTWYNLLHKNALFHNGRAGHSKPVVQVNIRDSPAVYPKFDFINAIKSRFIGYLWEKLHAFILITTIIADVQSTGNHFKMTWDSDDRVV